MNCMASPENKFIIAGSGRSGTTWVLDVLATAGKYKTIFEPLHPGVSKVAEKYAGKYIRPDTQKLDIIEFMDVVLSGEIKSTWTDYRVVADRLKPTLGVFHSLRLLFELFHRYKSLWNNYCKFKQKKHKGIAVKFIRANLMLGWLCGLYNIKTLFIIRHPGAVIESKIRLDAAALSAGLQHGTSDWDPRKVLNGYLNDENFCEDFLNRYIDKLDFKTMTDLEVHTVNWCLENAPVIEVAEKYNICITCYEDLVENSELQWKKIINYLGLTLKYNELNINKPSQQASEDFKKLGTTEEKLSRWMGRFSDAEKDSIDKILNLFKVNLYSAYKYMPIGNMHDETSRDHSR